MSYADENDDFEGEPEPRELPEVRLGEPGTCCVCGKPGCINGCFCCGKPVCYAITYYPEDSTCGGWILDSWHNDAPDENEFWCLICLPESDGATQRIATSGHSLYEEGQSLLVPLTEEDYQISDGVRYIKLPNNQYLRSWIQRNAGTSAPTDEPAS